MIPARRFDFLGLVFATTALLAVAPGAAAQISYHDCSLADHRTRYQTLRGAGYRLVSVDVAGDSGSQRWSAVWDTTTSRTTWTAEFGMSGGQLAQWRVARRAEGYRESWITSAGAGLSRVYGCVMVRDGLIAQTYQDIDGGSLRNVVSIAHSGGQLAVSASAHGTPSEPRFAIVFVENPRKIRWGYCVGETPTSYQDKFQAFVSQCFARPSVVTASSAHRYLGIFVDEGIGEWTARHGQTKSGFESSLAALSAQGYRVFQITVAGTGLLARYSSLYRRGSPPGKQVTVTGNGAAEFSGIDTIMVGTTRTQGFMQRENARQAAVAITKDGRLIFAKAYTYAEPGHPVALPTSGFRLGSVTKPLTAVGAYTVAQSRRAVSIDSRLVNLVALGTPADSRMNQITVRHLIDHRSGYASGWPLHITDKLAHARSTVQSDMLAFDPGTQTAYSNGGYQLLGVAIEQQTGMPYLDYMRRHVFGPLDVTFPHLLTLVQHSGDARCHEGAWGGSRTLRVEPSMVIPGGPLVNSAFAASPVHGDAAGGVVMSTVDLVRVLSGVFDRSIRTSVLTPRSRDLLEQHIQQTGGGWDFASQRNGPHGPYTYYQKGGLWRSAHAFAAWRTDGYAIAALCTGPTALDIAAINSVVDSVATWRRLDLFPANGMPAFQRKQPGSISTIGSGCGGSLGAPIGHAVEGTAEIGNLLRLDVTGVPASAPAFVFLGLSDTTLGQLSLPLDLALAGAPGCHLYVAPADVYPATGRVTRSATLGVPFDVQFVGARLFTQGAAVVRTANPLGMVFSNAVEVVVGG